MTVVDVTFGFIPAHSTAQDEARWCELLDDGERKRHARFLPAEVRRTFAYSHAMLREILGEILTVEPSSLEFDEGPHGRPSLPSAPWLSFNLSHTQGAAAVAVCREGCVGVDVEAVDVRRANTNVARRFFAPTEAETVVVLPPGETRAQRFFEFWTLKEAFLKARGTGLSTPLSHFAFEFDEGSGLKVVFDPRLHEEPNQWNFASFEPQAGFRAAVGLAGGDGRAELRVWSRQPLCGPERLEAVRWLRSTPGARHFLKT